MARGKGKPTRKGGKPPKRSVEGLAAFAGPEADSAAVAAAEEGSAKVRGKAAKRVGEPDDRTINIHIDTIKRAQAKHEVANKETKRLASVVRNAFKAAKAHGIDIDALKEAFDKAKRPAGEVIAEQRNVGRYLRVMEVPLGSQYTFTFDQPGEEQVVEVDAAAAGEQAGMNAEPKENNPHTPGTEPWFAWNNGHQLGTDRLAENLKDGTPGKVDVETPAEVASLPEGTPARSTMPGGALLQ